MFKALIVFLTLGVTAYPFQALASAPGVLKKPVPTAAAPPPPSRRPGRLPTQTGVASYYRGQGQNKTTASGAKLDPAKMTAASRTLPLGAKAKVTNAKTGAAAVVTITDRGPYAKNRILDVSPKAADRLGLKNSGVAPVKVTPLQPPPRSGPRGSGTSRRPKP